MSIPDMDADQCKAYFLDMYHTIDSFRLMFPYTWNEEVAKGLVDKWVVCTEVYPKIHTFQSITLLRKLCEHLDSIHTLIETIPDPE